MTPAVSADIKDLWERLVLPFPQAAEQCKSGNQNDHVSRMAPGEPFPLL